MPPNGQRLTAAIARFDALNRDDPNTEVQAGQSIPSQLLYAQRMTSTLERFAPDAPPAVRLAARAQHICRWKIPRESYPPGRDGYRRWRSDLGRFHAETAGSVLKEVGYDAPMIDHVAALLRKERLKADADCQLLEDVICLVFCQHYLADFAAKHDDTKLMNILRRTWQKMSPRGREAAMTLELSPQVRTLIGSAVGGE